jgi:hypothetical protein
MRDDDQLEIPAVFSALHQVTLELSQFLNIIPIQIGRGLIQGQNPTISPKGFGQCYPNYNTTQDLLPETAPAAHFQLSAIFIDVNNFIAEQFPYTATLNRLGPYENSFYIIARISLGPELFDPLVNFFHFVRVVFDQ